MHNNKALIAILTFIGLLYGGYLLIAILIWLVVYLVKFIIKKIRQ